MRKLILPALLALALGALSVHAQQAPVGAQTLTSEPGKATMTKVAKVSALVTGIDKTTRTVTLKGPKGRVIELVAGDEVRNFDQIRVGDEVVVAYLRALTLELRKGGGARVRVENADAVRAPVGAKPGAAAGRQVTVLADVIAVDAKQGTITVKGPKGNIVVLEVNNPDQFKVVKKGDQIEADYVEAVAISVEPAKK